MATWSERLRYENNLTLGVNDGAKTQDWRNIDLISNEQFARLQPWNRNREIRTTHFPKHLRKQQRPIEEDRQQLEREWWSWNWNVNSTRSQSSSASSTTWWQPREWQEPQERQKAKTARMAEMARVARTNTASLSRHSTWWTSSNVRGTSIIFAKQLHIRSLFFKEFRFQTISVSLWVTGSVNSTPHRARLTRATHTYVLVCTWLKMLGSCCSLVFLKNHSVSSMFHGTLLDAPFVSTILYSISDTGTQSDDYSFVALPFGEFNRCHSARRVALWPLGRTISSNRSSHAHFLVHQNCVVHHGVKLKTLVRAGHCHLSVLAKDGFSSRTFEHAQSTMEMSRKRRKQRN